MLGGAWSNQCSAGDYDGASPRSRAIANATTPTADPAPRYDLLAIDLDGTLLRNDKQAAKYDAVAITEAIRRGVKVVIATARPPRSSSVIHAKLGLDTPLINYNGALIHDVKNNTHQQHKPLHPDTARGIIRIARTIDPDVVVSIEILDKWYTDHDDPTLQTETGRRFKPDYVGPLDVPLQQPVTKLMLLAQGDRLKPIRDAVMPRFRGKAGFMLSDDHIMQVVHPAVDKGMALAWVAGSLGIPAERCCAIGDAPNDAGMLRWAGLGLAVANAFGSTRDSADHILEHTNDQWAVGRAIERYVLEDDPIARRVAAHRGGSGGSSIARGKVKLP